MAAQFGQKTPRPRYHSRPRWQTRNAIPRAFAARAQYVHSAARLEKREGKIYGAMGFVNGIMALLAKLARRLGLVKRYKPPKPERNFKVDYQTRSLNDGDSVNDAGDWEENQA